MSDSWFTLLAGREAQYLLDRELQMSVLQIILVITHIFALICGYYMGREDGFKEGKAIGYRRGQAINKAVNR